MDHLSISNPATGEKLAELACDDGRSIRLKFGQAQAAQKEWAKAPFAERKRAIERFASLLEGKTEELARLLTGEMGKPISQSRNEIRGVQARISFFLGVIERLTSDEAVFEDASIEEKITYEPLGVIANISAWNYPYFVGSNVFVPALLTGNSVLYKPSEFATLTGLALADLLQEAGIPEHVFQPILGDGRAGATLLDLPLQGIFFTGSHSTGSRIAQAASAKMIRVQLELGGKDPVYVTDDTDIEKAAESTADGAFYNCGQSCCSVERIYVHEAIYDRYLEAFSRIVVAYAIGDPMDDTTYLGPLARAAQIPVIEGQIADALEKGARLMTGGKRSNRRGNYFEPTVLADVRHDMLVMREETFGPLIGIQKVRNDTEASELMNDTRYGLTAGVYCRSRDRAENILRNLNTGSVYWNCCDRVSPRLPWSGRKDSGIGSTLGWAGIHAFIQPKAWHLRSP